MDSAVSKEFMRRMPLFSDLSEDDLDQLYEMARTVRLPAGERFIEEGADGDELFIVVDGEVEITRREGGGEVVLATRGAGDFVGEMSLLERVPRTASVQTLRDSRLLVISHAAFQTLLSCSPSAPLTILRTVTARLRSNEALLMQKEKLAALGTMAAGLAHELNNPAAAIRRSSAHLREALEGWERAATELGTLTLDPGEREALRVLREEADQRARRPDMLDPLARSEQEDEVQEWLAGHGIDQGWEIASVLVSSGWTAAALADLDGRFAPAQLPGIVRWLAGASAVYGLLDEVGKSGEAISEIVRGVKSYVYLDQAPIQEIDLHENLETTLVILRHKLKAGVQLVRDYADDLPRIEGYGSELNQVWTNLIDNAVDAMEGKGRLTLRTCRKAREVMVQITDEGPGIPPEIQPRIFEPFFTTKAPSLGTGLGLHIVYNIVVHKHHGQVRVESQPGQTTFEVRLPLRLPRG